MSKSLASQIVEDFVRIKEISGRDPKEGSYNRVGKFPLSLVKEVFGSWLTAMRAAGDRLKEAEEKQETRNPKVLIIDIESAPMLAYAWGLFDQNIGINQIKEDWHLLSVAAKWFNEDKIFYWDQRKAKRVEDDKALLKNVWALLNQADVVLGQNSKRFDTKKLNARFIINGIEPPRPYAQIDTLAMMRKNFAFSSNKLEYASGILTPEYKKDSHKKFHGFELWKECLAGNQEAFKEMESYNKKDVLATEALYKKLAPWGGSGVDLNVFRGTAAFACQCGSTNIIKRGFKYTKTGKFAQFTCKDCGHWFNESGADRNLIGSRKKDSLKGQV